MGRIIPPGGTVFETKRLIVRAAQVGDVPVYFALWTNPDIMKNMGFPHGLPITREEIAAKIGGQGEAEYGRLLVAELKSTGQVIGECKLYLPNDEGISETDVKLLPRFWGHKYGVEIKQGLVDYLFTNTKCTAVQGTPNVANIASIKMQEAVGAVRIAERVYEFSEDRREGTCPVHHHVYQVFRAVWQQKH
ncbi:MAG: GNAT family N-acetyltransferase [Ardenticatenaceae bacterium]|nr:GNAT family N-acetyltransferase [Ardenticatenaceae bacterium]